MLFGLIPNKEEISFGLQKQEEYRQELIARGRTEFAENKKNTVGRDMLDGVVQLLSVFAIRFP